MDQLGGTIPASVLSRALGLQHGTPKTVLKNLEYTAQGGGHPYAYIGLDHSEVGPVPCL